MRRVFYLSFIYLIVFFTYVNSQTIREMKFENVKLEIVLKTLSEVSKKNIIIDPEISGELGKKVSVSIYRPVKVEEAFNIILREFDLIAVPVNKNIYKITKAEELTQNIEDLSDEDIKNLLKAIRNRLSPVAEVTIDRTLGFIYIRDEADRVEKLKPLLENYRKIVKKEIMQEKEKVTEVRVFYLKNISTGEALRMLKPLTTKDTVITESPTFNALVITDTPDQLALYEKTLSKFLVEAPTERKPVTKIFYLKYISPQEFIRMIEPIRSEAGLILSGGAFTTPAQKNEKAQPTPVPILKDFNAVMITDYPEVIEEIKEKFKDYISDVPPQVRIEARVVEVRKEALRELGINWSAIFSQNSVPRFWEGGVGSNLGVATNLTPLPVPGLSPTPGGIAVFTYGQGALNALNLRLSAMERVLKVKSLAKPSIVTVNGQKATIKQGTEIPYVTAAAGAAGTAIPNVQFKEVTLELNVTPIISPDGRVLLDISLKHDTLGQQTAQGPAINTKEAQTKVIVNDGETIVIGGILDSSDNDTREGIAGLVRIPILQWIFGQQRKEMRDVELLIFMTPFIVRN